jgi:hypothetical protein
MYGKKLNRKKTVRKLIQNVVRNSKFNFVRIEELQRTKKKSSLLELN